MGFTLLLCLVSSEDVRNIILHIENIFS